MLAYPNRISARDTTGLDFGRVLFLGAALLSAGIECFQVLLPSRTPALADVLANLTGFLLGAVDHAIGGNITCRPTHSGQAGEQVRHLDDIPHDGVLFNHSRPAGETWGGRFEVNNDIFSAQGLSKAGFNRVPSTEASLDFSVLEDGTSYLSHADTQIPGNDMKIVFETFDHKK